MLRRDHEGLAIDGKRLGKWQPEVYAGTGRNDNGRKYEKALLSSDLELGAFYEFDRLVPRLPFSAGRALMVKYSYTFGVS
jgi:hypothetical protein